MPYRRFQRNHNVAIALSPMLQAGSTVQQRTPRVITAAGSGTGESSVGNPRGQLQDLRKHPTPSQPPRHRPGGKKKADERKLKGVSEGDPHYNEISIQA